MIKALVYNKDIITIKKKAEKGFVSFEEAALLRESSWSESKIQQACKNIFRSRFMDGARFIQTDNARATKNQRMKAGREGCEKGMLDIILVGEDKKIVFVEFKRIDSPKRIQPTKEQIEKKQFFERCGFPAYFCNNTVYFEKVICNNFLPL